MISRKCLKTVILSYVFTTIIFAFPFSPWVSETFGQILRDKTGKQYYLFSLINQTGFIRKKAVDATGYIFKVKDDKAMISNGDTVYIKGIRNSKLIFGRRYTVYETKPAKDRKTGTDTGTQHYIKGIAEVIKKERGFVVAVVNKTYRTITLNDLLMPYNEKKPKILLVKSKQGINGEIIGSDKKMEIMGENNVAFINKGRKNGIVPGQFYEIYYQEEVQPDPEVETKLRLTPVVFGELFVLHTEDTTSTVVITKSHKAVYVGARFRTHSKR
ncbi:MAG: hypothetical protein GY749_12475 [Desulfobacteraceae bacterium]|nr:hypothetical protein [Desulfobacteraceae bacterium]